MSARPGFVTKHVPLRIPGPGPLLSGGRYLFDTLAHARAYQAWVEYDFTLDGVKFFDRPYISNPGCRVWSVGHGAQVVTRTERWQVPHGTCVPPQARAALVAEATKRSLTSVWPLTAPGLTALVYYRDRALPPNPADHNDPQKVAAVSLAAIESPVPLGAVIRAAGWAKLFDRSSWVLTTWFPFAPCDRGAPPLWPNSPPLPKPSL
jgi:hypothetical protein